MQTKAGALKTVKTNKTKYGSDFYSRIGSEGGKASSNGGFASNKIGLDGLTGKERAKTAGRKGGYISKRGVSKSKPAPQETKQPFWKRIFGYESK